MCWCSETEVLALVHKQSPVRWSIGEAAHGTKEEAGYNMYYIRSLVQHAHTHQVNGHPLARQASLITVGLSFSAL